MNICFFTSEEVSPIIGGIQRITYTVAQSLNELYGWECYSVFCQRSDMEGISTVFADTLMIGKPWKDASLLVDALKRWHIDIFVNQSCFWMTSAFKDAVNRVGCKYVFCHHFAPASEIHLRPSFWRSWVMWKDHPSCKGFVKNLLYPYYSYRASRNDSQTYAKVYQQADKVVLLSERFIPEYVDYAGISDTEKFAVVHNSLSFDTFLDCKSLETKGKEVLVVSRLAETQKKISIVLRVWEEIEKDETFGDWRLSIVGTGDDERRYRRFAEKRHLRRVSFEGKQAPQAFYQRSSIFLMTSSTEGWGLTLTEAQQYGCVPLAFDTYAAVHDIIQDGENGFVIPPYDVRMYVERLKSLMSDGQKRISMAASAIESSHRFERNVIAAQWHQLFTEVYEKR